MYKTNYKMRYNGGGGSTFEKGKLYTIKYISEDNKLLMMITEDNRVIWYPKRFFDKDLVEERKQKLKNINSL